MQGMGMENIHGNRGMAAKPVVAQKDRLAGGGGGSNSLPEGLNGGEVVILLRSFLKELEALVESEPRLKQKLAAIYARLGGTQ